jgi:hypothetical protein
VGIYIEAYAIDLSALTMWVDRSVGDALFYLARNASVDDRAVFIAYDPKTKYRYSPRSSGRVVRSGNGSQIVEISEGDGAAIPLFQRSLVSYLKRGSVYDLKFLLDCLSSCTDVSFVKQLTDGYRRSWIGSVLQTSKDLALLPNQEQIELENFFRKILHGWDCDYPVERWTQGFGLDRFPFAPEEDPDTRLTVMSETDCGRLLTLIERILGQNPRFVPPADTDFADDKTDWDGWVRSMLDAFLVMRTLRFRELRLLTFIG